MKKFTLLLIGFSLFVTTSIMAQDSLHLTLDTAVGFALKQNPQLLRTQLDEEINRSKIREIKASALPQLSANGSFTDNYSLASQLLPGELFGQPGTTIPVKFGTRYVSSGSVQLDQTLFNKSLFTGLKAAKSSQQLYEFNTFKSKEDVVYNVVQLYLQLQISNRQRVLLDENLSRSQKLFAISEQQLKEGIIKKVDLDQQRVNLTNQQTEIYNIQINYNQQLNLLKVLMGLPIETPVAIIDSVENRNNLVVSQELQIHQNTDLKILEIQKSLNKLDRENIRAGYFPTLSLYTNYSKQAQSQDLFKGNGNSFGAGAWGLRLSVPIFDGGAKRQRVIQNLIQERQIELDKKYATADVQATFINARQKVAQNSVVLNAQAQNMKLAEELYNVTTLSFREGVAPLTELINAENSLRQAQSQYITSLLQSKLAELDLLKDSGQLAQLIRQGENN